MAGEPPQEPRQRAQGGPLPRPVRQRPRRPSRRLTRTARKAIVAGLSAALSGIALAVEDGLTAGEVGASLSAGILTAAATYMTTNRTRDGRPAPVE